MTTQNATWAPLLSMTQPEIAEAKAIPKPAPVIKANKCQMRLQIPLNEF